MSNAGGTFARSRLAWVRGLFAALLPAALLCAAALLPAPTAFADPDDGVSQSELTPHLGDAIGDFATETPDGTATEPETATETGPEADSATESGTEADPSGQTPGSTLEDPADPTKPYSTLTPVGGYGNTQNAVNTHQLPDSSFLYDTSVTDLAGANSYFDGQTVQIIGEVIGDILIDSTTDSHVWVTLTSTDSSDATIVIYLPAASASIIDTLGAYGKTGTVLQVRGTFHLVCPDHQGISDIHVENANVVEPGVTSPDVFSWELLKPGILMLLLAGALLFVFHMLRQRLR